MPVLGARPGNPLGLAPGQHVRLFDAYAEAHETWEAAEGDGTGSQMSASDFPTYIASLMRHTFLDRFQEVQGVWSQYTRDFSVEDFEDWTYSRFGRFPDIEEKPLQGPYNRISLKELPGAKIRLREFGNSWGLTRKLIIEDRLNKISEFPQLAADALARTMAKAAAVDGLQSNPTMWDGEALFSSAHSNLGSATALTATAAGAALLQALELLLTTQTDDEGYKVVPPGGQITVVIPVQYRWIANALDKNQVVINGSNYLEPNPIQGRYTWLEEPYFTDVNNYYMGTDFKGPLGFLAHVTLNGNDTPFIGLQDPGVRAVLGGNDPYSFEFDEIAYKLRHDFNFIPVEWRGIVAALPA